MERQLQRRQPALPFRQERFQGGVEPQPLRPLFVAQA
jgi:hypothetical protein